VTMRGAFSKSEQQALSKLLPLVRVYAKRDQSVPKPPADPCTFVPLSLFDPLNAKYIVSACGSPTSVCASRQSVRFLFRLAVLPVTFPFGPPLGCSGQGTIAGHEGDVEGASNTPSHTGP
jgi:hypothetical protein